MIGSTKAENTRKSASTVKREANLIRNGGSLDLMYSTLEVLHEKNKIIMDRVLKNNDYLLSVSNKSRRQQTRDLFKMGLVIYESALRAPQYRRNRFKQPTITTIQILSWYWNISFGDFCQRDFEADSLLDK